LKLSQKNYNRVVIKIGSSLLCRKSKGIDPLLVENVAAQVLALRKEGKEVILVSSGAIALGMSVLGLTDRPKELSYLQAAAAVGQSELMKFYRQAFEKKGLTCAQVLLTWDDFSGRKRYLNAKNTILTLLKLGCIPIINENDTVSTEEIKFGDNDRLSALVAALAGADLLVMLSDVDGLLDKEKKLVRIVAEIDHQIKSFACPTDKKTCVGGMITKIEAAKIAMHSGIPCVIANGACENIIISATENPSSSGTLFVPNKGFLQARKRWIAFGSKPKGKIIVDDGAKAALLNKKSLLSVGVVGVEGNFENGEVIAVLDSFKNEIARGKSGLSSQQLNKVKGGRFDKEVIHRDNIVII